MQFHLPATFGALHFSGRAIQRVKQRGDRQLALTVNADIANVLGVEFKIKPGTTIRNDARGKQILAAGMRFAPVMVKKDTRAAMHLGNNNTFRAIDDEGTVVGHERHIAHVDILFLDVAHRTAAGFLIHIPNDQAQPHLERRGIGQPALDAFLNIIFRIFEFVLHELQATTPGEIINRKDRTEHFLQTRDGARIRKHFHLQEAFIGCALHINKVRHRRHFWQTPEALADPLTPGERLGDRVHACPALLYLSCRPTLPARVIR